MKQIVKITAALGLLGTFTLASCEKCHECHYDGPEGYIEIGEYCGDDLKALEENGYTMGDTVYTAHCEEH
ncbi:hypothetical protein N8987_06445 [Crocinitomix sp.]|nr:hypothetical protein [Crocinitomix sp.]